MVSKNRGKQNDYKIAVIGAGIAGLAIGQLLAKLGYQVDLYEQFDEPRSVGAGLLLQPIGVWVLQKMGILDEIGDKASRVDLMQGTNHKGKRTMDIRYADLAPDKSQPLFGLGVHRTNLFNTLYQNAINEGVCIHTNTEILGWTRMKGKYQLLGSRNTSIQSGAIIIANGTQSKLREFLDVGQQVDWYRWGALWAVLKDPGDEIAKSSVGEHAARRYANALEQRYQRANLMAGILPTGKHPDTGEACLSFFWSLPVEGYRAWQESDFNGWKQCILNFEPSYSAILEQLHSHTDLTFARYANVVMNKWHHNEVVCIGDAAHGMSPQLGLGANLALVDALVLAQCMAKHQETALAFSSYSRERKKHLAYYQLASRLLTPLFQSNSRSAAVLRDITFPLMNKLPFVYKEALRTIAGIKTGILFDKPVFEI